MMEETSAVRNDDNATGEGERQPEELHTGPHEATSVSPWQPGPAQLLLIGGPTQYPKAAFCFHGTMPIQ